MFWEELTVKKLLSAILAMALLTAVLTACGDKDTSIKMTDTFTFEDPADLEFDSRYVVYGDKNCVPVANTPGMLTMYDVYYADADGAPVANYKYMTFDTAENATAYIADRAEIDIEVLAVEEDPCVVYSCSENADVAGMIDMFYSGGSIEEATVSAYVAYYAEAIGATVQ